MAVGNTLGAVLETDAGHPKGASPRRSYGLRRASGGFAVRSDFVIKAT